jgi:uncharacterized protein YdeI (BOF family)
MWKHPTAKPTVLAIAIAGALGVTGAQAAQPYQKPDDSFVSISGTVTSPSADDFVLDYGSGTILVEMDDWDSYGDAYSLMDGDRVTVFGRIDDDFFEVAKVEAGSVYVENLNTYFYANAADEETKAWDPQYWTAPSPIVVSAMTLRGDIVDVDVEEREFTVDSGGAEVTVDASALGYNPLDDNGYQQLDEGDFVSVSGMMDYAFMDGRVFKADAVTTLVDEQQS